MKSLILLLTFSLSLFSAIAQNNIIEDLTFLDVDHSKTLFSYGVDPSKADFFVTDEGNYYVVNISDLINPFRGNEEYLSFSGFDVASQRAFFDAKGRLAHLDIEINNLGQLPDILKLLNRRFGSYVYNDGFYRWETKLIVVYLYLHEGSEFHLISMRK